MLKRPALARLYRSSVYLEPRGSPLEPDVASHGSVGKKGRPLLSMRLYKLEVRRRNLWSESR